ncbi:hypothetical protein [Provencibacterium massiliense]|uniref:hypothetical protein n=1 Tax=Provencibacterium massiliense TaxID=1841868 RepID=UPI0009A7B16C|nr:hypothetical protein [Provencibacterium massiliense]RGB66487.1 hypothetical protein DW086_08415 [Harryflintia acetispora]
MSRDLRTYRGYGNRRYSRKVMFFISLAISLCVAGIVVGVIIHDWMGQAKAFSPDGYETAAQVGMLTDTKAGDLWDLDSFSYRLNEKPVVSSKEGTANLRIENPPENQQLMRVTLTLADGTQLYRSGLIKPYHYVEHAALSFVPELGSHEATALIEACDSVSGQTLHTVEKSLTLTVL